MVIFVELRVGQLGRKTEGWELGESWVRKSSKEEEKSGELLGNGEKNIDEGMSQGRDGPWVLRFGEKKRKKNIWEMMSKKWMGL